MPATDKIGAYLSPLRQTSTTAFSLDYAGSDCVVALAWSDSPNQQKNYIAVLTGDQA